MESRRREDFFRLWPARKPSGVFSARTPRGRPLADTSPARVVREASSSENPPLISAGKPVQIQKKSSACTSCGRRARGFLMLAAVVVARGADPGAVRIFDPPAHRAGLQKNIPIRVYPCPSVVKNARFSGFQGPFWTLFTCAARCGSFPIRKPSLAKDAKDAKKLSRNLTPLGALCDLCERNCPKKCRFSGRTCHAERVNLSRRRRERLFGLFFTCASRCGSFPIRKPSLAKDAKKLLRCRTPLGALCDLCERNCPKNSGFQAENYRAEAQNGRFQPKNGIYGSFFAFQTCCGSFPLTIFCPKLMLETIKSSSLHGAGA